MANYGKYRTQKYSGRGGSRSALRHSLAPFLVCLGGAEQHRCYTEPNVAAKGALKQTQGKNLRRLNIMSLAMSITLDEQNVCNEAGGPPGSPKSVDHLEVSISSHLKDCAIRCSSSVCAVSCGCRRDGPTKRDTRKKKRTAMTKSQRATKKSIGYVQIMRVQTTTTSIYIYPIGGYVPGARYQE